MASFDSISAMVGKTIIEVNKNDDNNELIFIGDDGTQYKFYHSQDCCETVQIEDICGDLENLVGSPILTAEERTSREGIYDEGNSTTWTFYEFATNKGSVTIRWYGTSNGYYSESVDFAVITS